MLICNASHWLEYPYKQLPSVWGDESGCRSGSVTLWKGDKNWMKRASKRICSLLSPWQLQRLWVLRWEQLFCGTFYMNEVFVYNWCLGNSLFTVMAMVFSFVAQLHSHWWWRLKVDVWKLTFFKFHFDFSLISKASFNRVVASHQDLTHLKFGRLHFFSVLNFSGKAHERWSCWDLAVEWQGEKAIIITNQSGFRGFVGWSFSVLLIEKWALKSILNSFIEI